MTSDTTSGLVLPLGDRRPDIDPEAWLAPYSVVSGSVRIGAGSSVWYGTSVRGDNEQITLGERVNLQDNVVVHADEGFPTTVEDDVSVGHGAVLHGCSVGSGTIVGMGAVVMNGARIGASCLVAGGAVVLEGTEVPDGSLVAGVPARVRRELTEEERGGLRQGVNHYPGLAQIHREALADR
ncbi:gamma carbonic anhydrase family protein [Ornithinimicrobium sp. Y1847]|uniref:gamma carbonic anhydrase family protein n=1 Tax=Ornithinimicrobium sp. Y1847 TaxID=3405419 RepID=UPI003B67C6AF